MRRFPWLIVPLLLVAPCLGGLSQTRVRADEPAKLDVASPLVDVHLQGVEIRSDRIDELPDLCTPEDRNAAYWLVYEVLGRPNTGEPDDYSPRHHIVEADRAKTLARLLHLACRHDLAKMLADPILTAAVGSSLFFNGGRDMPNLRHNGRVIIKKSRIEHGESLWVELKPTNIPPTLEYRRIGTSLDVIVNSIESDRVQLDLSPRLSWLRPRAEINRQRLPGSGGTYEGKWTGEIQFGAGVLLSAWRRNTPSTTDFAWPQNARGPDVLPAEPIETLVFARVEKHEALDSAVNASAASATNAGPSQRLLSIQAIEYSPARIETWQPQGLNDEETRAWQLLRPHLLRATTPKKESAADQPVLPLKSTPIKGVLRAAAQADVVTILAEPNLLVVDGQEGKFNSGGEFVTPREYRGALSDDSAAPSHKYGTQIEAITKPAGDGSTRWQIRFTLSEVNQQFSQRIGDDEFPGFSIRNFLSMGSVRPDQTWIIRGWHDVRFTDQLVRSPGQRHAQLVRTKSNVETMLLVQTEPVDNAPSVPVVAAAGSPKKEHALTAPRADETRYGTGRRLRRRR